MNAPADRVSSAPGPAWHLAGHEQRGEAHICSFFPDRPSAERALFPFVKEGLDAGDRVVYVVAAKRRDTLLAALHRSGVDVDDAVAHDRLKVEVWEDTYLRGGRFDQTGMLKLILGILAEGRSLGFARTRYVANMEWALTGPTWIQDLAEYEARVDRALGKLPDIVVCSYDVRHLGEPVAVDILAAHPLALVGGALKSTRIGPDRPSARDRVLKAADRLFFSQGVQSTSIDAVIAAADVARATLYRYFPTKDDLVVAWLQDARPRWFDRVRAMAESRAGGDAGAVPLRLFDAVAEWLEAEGFRGCPYLNTSIEIADPAHPVHEVIRAYLHDIEDQIRLVLEAAGIADASSLAPQLQTLIAGSITLAISRRTTDSVMSARDAAARLLAPAGRDSAAS